MNEVKNTIGRPREHDREAIAAKLVEWAKLDNSLNLNAFCSQNLIPPSNLGIWAKQCNDFRRAYELAKSFIGVRREQKLSEGALHVKAYDLNAATYDYFLKEERREEKSFEAELRAKEAIDIHKNVGLMTQYPKLKPNDILEVPPTQLPTPDTLGA